METKFEKDESSPIIIERLIAFNHLYIDPLTPIDYKVLG